MNYLFYYPNRPMLIAPDKEYIETMERTGNFKAEQKFNGDNIQIDIDSLEFWNRQGQRHRYQPDEATRKELQALPKHAVFNAELMHYKTKSWKNTIIIHSCMIWQGRPLIGKTWGDSREICEDLALPQTIFGQTSYTSHVLLSRTTHKGFWNLYKMADGENFEGIVIKNPAGKLVYSTQPLSNDGAVSYMYKVRIPSKKYSF